MLIPDGRNLWKLTPKGDFEKPLKNNYSYEIYSYCH